MFLLISKREFFRHTNSMITPKLRICFFFLGFYFQSQDLFNFSAVLKAFILIFWSFVQLFVICDCSERVTTRFNEIDIYLNCNWYLFPMGVRRMLPTIMMNTQKHVGLRAFGNIPCNRNKFEKVWHTFDLIFHRSLTFFLLYLWFLTVSFHIYPGG